VLVGRVVRPHGLRGAVVVEVFTDRPAERFAPGAVVELADGSLLTVAAFQVTDRLPLVTFEEVSDRNAAERLRGKDLSIPSVERRPLEEGEFWPDELVGMEVVGPSGEHVGEVVDVEIGVGQDRLSIVVGDRTISVPFVAELVPEVDTERRRIVIDPPPGLID